MTAQEFEALDDAGLELDDGVLVERAVSVLSSMIGQKLAQLIGVFVRSARLGFVLGPDIGLQIFPDRPRRIPRPDIAFVAGARVTPEVLLSGHLRIPPDLVVEVVSPGDNSYALDRKVNEYLGVGVRLVWVVHPVSERGYVYRLDGSGDIIPRDGELDGEDVLPGFRVPLADVFEGVPDASLAAPDDA